MKKVCLTLQDFFNLNSAVIYNPDLLNSIFNVSIDSRNIKRGSLFIAIKGEKFDGHEFVRSAIKKGAAAVMIDSANMKNFTNVSTPIIAVKDTNVALGDIAAVWRKKLKTKIIGLTGSSGKTTTKEILFTLLKEKYSVNKTVANNNNHIGVPLTVLSSTNNHQFLIAEQGTNHFGEIKYTSSITNPDFALITNIGNSHLEFLKNKNGVLKEKSELFKAAVKQNGKIFINNDDDLLSNYGKKLKNKITFGLNKNANYKASIIKIDSQGHPLIQIKYHKKTFTAKLPIVGKSNVMNFLSAFAIAKELKLSDTQIQSGIRKLKSFDKRLQTLKFSNTLIINDTYNANPESMRSSLNLLAELKPKYKKVAVLGDMFELGKDTAKFHRELGILINELKIDEVYSIGKFSKDLNMALNGRVSLKDYFNERSELKKFLSKIDLNKKVILFKGSRGMKMEEFLNVIEMRLR